MSPNTLNHVSGPYSGVGGGIRGEWTAAVWTPPGRGAIATVRVVSGSNGLASFGGGLFRAASGRALCDLPANQICFGQWSSGTIEEVVVCRDSENSFEVHCHGGHAAVQRILSDLQHAGCTIVDWPTQWQATASLLDREYAEALSRATTTRTAAWIVAQDDRLQRTFDWLQEQFAAKNWSAVIAKADEILKWAEFGRHLTRPWSVVVAGRPNVGKSSLINALVGYERSIVFDQPGTTRDVVTAETVLDGWPIQLSDTAGQRCTQDELESSGIARARAALAAADCRILVIDTSEPPHADDLRLLAEKTEALLVAHKSDLPDQWGVAVPEQAIHVSSLRRTGLETLSTAIVRRLVPELPSEAAVVPLTERQIGVLMDLRSAANFNVR